MGKEDQKMEEKVNECDRGIEWDENTGVEERDRNINSK